MDANFLGIVEKEIRERRLKGLKVQVFDVEEGVNIDDKLIVPKLFVLVGMKNIGYKNSVEITGTVVVFTKEVIHNFQVNIQNGFN